MENIKFRAWDKDGKFMTDPFYLGSLNAGEGFTHDWESMLYTGVKDKHGIEICEGDIISYEWGDGDVTNEYVSFEDGCFWLGDQAFIDIPKTLAKSEIIGNIHENPELLEKR